MCAMFELSFIVLFVCRKMNVDPDVNYDELARCTDDFNGAQCKAVCVEAGTSKIKQKSF
jgi:26S proteasome regulatory subunit T5